MIRKNQKEWPSEKAGSPVAAVSLVLGIPGTEHLHHDYHFFKTHNLQGFSPLLDSV